MRRSYFKFNYGLYKRKAVSSIPITCISSIRLQIAPCFLCPGRLFFHCGARQAWIYRSSA